MSFLIGPSPIRRTLNYLKSCPLIFKDQVKVVEIHYNLFRNFLLKKPINDVHVGLREFYYWNSDAIQFQNPSIQIVRFTDSNPIPLIRCWLETGEDVLFDCDSKTKDEIMNQLIKILGKSEKDIEQEKISNQEATKENPAVFGFGKERFCICEIDGQVPCPGVVELPMHMKSKYIYEKPDDLEAYENNADAEQWNYEYIRNKYWHAMTLPPEQDHFKGIERIQLGKLPPRTRTNIFEKQQKTYLELKKERENERATKAKFKRTKD